MRDPSAPFAGGPRHRDVEATSRALARQAAALALRLAELIETRCSAESGAPEATEFLREWAQDAGGPRTAWPAPTGSPTVAGERAPVGEPSGPGSRGEPFEALVAGLGLSPVEAQMVLLAGLPEEHEGLASTFRTLNPRGEPRPTVGLAALVFQDLLPDRAAVRQLLVEGPAVVSGLLSVTGEGTWFERSLVLADQVWNALHDVDAWPAALSRVEVPAPPAGLDGWLGLPAVHRALEAITSGEGRMILVGSADEPIAVSRCSALARQAGRDALAARLSPDDAAAVALLGLHAVVRAAVPVIVVPEPAEGRPAPTPDLRRVVAGPVLVCAAPGAVRPPLDRPVLMVPPGPIGVQDRRAAWEQALAEAGEYAAELAARHPLDPAMTALVALDVDGSARPGSGPLDLAAVSATIRARAGITLPAGVDLVSPRAGWATLVVDGEAQAQLQDAVARLAHQSQVLDDWGLREAARADRGVRILLSGPPGTGKSLAAEVVAFAASTDLLVVDASRVVSKWLGETEKNLAAVFDVAERTQAVLFLDEADALFATRTEVSDSHDRYANLETSWLLQRLDRFDGLAVLATNLRRNIDVAFVRRMDYVVEFALPDQASRLLLWQAHLPEALRGPDVDLPVLARRFAIPGAWIRNATIAAAFAAASGSAASGSAASGQVGQDQLIAAVRREYAKATKPFPDEPPTPDTRHRDDEAARQFRAHAAGTARTES